MDFNQDFEQDHNYNAGNDNNNQYDHENPSNQPYDDARQQQYIQSGSEQQSNQQQQQQQDQEQTTQPSHPKAEGICSYFSIEFYQPLFNVSTNDVKQRIRTALIPNKPDFFAISRDHPDLYGPFWVCFSLVFIIACVGNIQAYFSAAHKEYFHFDYSFVPLGAMLVFTIGFGTPVLLTFLMKCFGNNVSMFSIICLYGYSMSAYIFATVLCIIPFNPIQWVFLVIGTGISIGFMLVNLYSEFATYEKNKYYLVLGIIIGVQIAFLFFLKLYFFANFNIKE